MTALRAAVLGATAAAVLAAAPSARATSISNPIGAPSVGQFALAAEAEHVVTAYPDEGIASHRYLAKGIYRLNPWCDVFLRAGAADIDAEGAVFGEPAEIDGSAKFSWGGGVRAHVWRSASLPFSPRLVLGGEVLVLQSESAIERTIGPTLTQRQDSEYSWREYEGSATVVLRWKAFYPYGGWAFRNVEGDFSRTHSDDDGTTTTIVSSSQGDFTTGVRAYPLAGVDYAAGDRFHISAQGFWRNDNDYGLFFGISETSH
jgi:hypothetical protein